MIPLQKQASRAGLPLEDVTQQLELYRLQYGRRANFHLCNYVQREARRNRRIEAFNERVGELHASYQRREGK